MFLILHKQRVLIKKFEQKIQEKLPGRKAHRELVPPNRSLDPQNPENTRKSAILALLHENTQGDYHILLIERQLGGLHGGQIAFPGGKYEEGDKSLWHTALRETHEEVGLAASNIALVGALTKIHIPISNFDVTPYLGFFREQNNPKIINDPTEIAGSFWISLESILSVQKFPKKNIKTHRGVTIKNVPHFKLNNKIIWGATALIINEIRHLAASK